MNLLQGFGKGDGIVGAEGAEDTSGEPLIGVLLRQAMAPLNL